MAKAPVQVNITIDRRKFDASMAEALKYSKRLPAETTNNQGYFTSIHWMKSMKGGSAEKIEKQLGDIQVVTVVSTNKLGKVSTRKTTTFQSSLGKRIIQARRKAKGLKLYSDLLLNKMVKKLITARKKTVGFIKTGPLAAIQKLAPFVKHKNLGPKMDERKPRQSVEKKGGSTHAAEFARQAITTIWTGVKGGLVVAPAILREEIRSMNDALAKATVDNLRYIRRKQEELKGIFRK